MSTRKENLILFKNLRLDRLRDYCDFFDKHDLETLTINHADIKLQFKAPVAPGVQGSTSPQALASASPTSVGGEATTQSVLPEQVSEKGADVKDIDERAAGLDDKKTIRAPMTGTFYTSPTPNTPAYIRVGERIAKGQKVCILEAMKIMNEIESPIAGVVKTILIQNGKSVLKDAPLIVLT